MAITSAFQYTNTTATTHKSVSLKDMGETSNYALVKDEPNEVKLSNITAPTDAGEILSYSGKYMSSLNTSLKVPTKASATGYVQYRIKLEDDLVSLDSADPKWRQDDVIVAYLTILHPVSGYVTDSKVGDVVTRLISSCQHAADGSWRFSELMRNALKPTSN